MASRPAASTSSAASALRLVGDRAIDRRRAGDGGKITHAPEKPPGNARRAPRAPRDLVGAVGGHRDAKHARAAIDDQLEFGLGIKIEPHRDAEAVAQRISQKPGPGGGADQREFRQIDLDRARRRPGADNEVELKVLHGRIEDFLDRGIEPVNFVDKKHVALFEIGQKRRKVAGLGDHRARGGAEIDGKLARHDLRQRGLAEAGRPDKQHVIERFLARSGGSDENAEVTARLLLADEL
jgi:hypothetical protein